MAKTVQSIFETSKFILFILLLVILSERIVEAAPSVSVSPVTGQAGSDVTLSGNGYTGNVPANILWDGERVDVLSIPETGSFRISFVIPPSTSVGLHDLTVCSGTTSSGDPVTGCFTGEFEEKATTSFEVTAEISETGTFNVQIIALEVTQGVRGDIPKRTAPSGGRMLNDDAVHVANRTTVVRAYPWVQVSGGATVPPLSARLRAFKSGVELSGSPISPIEPLLDSISSAWTINDMRSDIEKTWNFLLPLSWVSADGPGEEAELTFVVQANPPGPSRWPECSGCDADNEINLTNERFIHVRSEQNPIILHPFLIDFTFLEEIRDASCNVTDTVEWYAESPTTNEFFKVLNTARNLLPIGNRALFVQPIRVIDYAPSDKNPTGRIKEDIRNDACEIVDIIPVFKRTMIRDYFPGGVEDGAPEDHYYLFVFNPTAVSESGDSNSKCAGESYYSAYIETGNCGFAMAHELSHSLGLSHADFEHTGDSGYDTSYPGDHGQVENNTYGLDWREGLGRLRVVVPVHGSGREEVTHDFMSYAGPQWVSRHNWDKLADLLGGSAILADADESYKRMPRYEWKTLADLLGQPFIRVAAASPSTTFSQGAHLVITGHIGMDETVDLYPLFSAPRSFNRQDANANPSVYSIEFRGKNGKIVGSHLISHVQSADSLGPVGLSFSESVDPPAGWKVLAIMKKQAEELAAFRRSDKAPSLSIVAPINGDVWGASGKATVSWEASDPDGQSLSFRVEGGSADGKTWVTLASDVNNKSTTIDLSNIPGGGKNWFIRVQASDGLNVTASKARSVKLAAKPPQTFIFNPVDASILKEGRAVILEGQASDWVDGQIEGARLQWLLNGKVKGKGELFKLRGLKSGKYSLILRATNSAGLTGESKIQFAVAPK